MSSLEKRPNKLLCPHCVFAWLIRTQKTDAISLDDLPPEEWKITAAEKMRKQFRNFGLDLGVELS